MLDIQQKRKFRGFLYHRFTIGVLLILTILVAHSTWRVYTKKRESITMKNASEYRFNELQMRNEELDQKIRKLATVSGVEEEIRSKFSVVKGDESMVIIVREEATVTDTVHKSNNLWSKIKNLFK